MGQARLTTARLDLRPLADEHLPYELELDSDPEVLRYLFSRAHTPEEVARAHDARRARSREVDGLGVWMGFAGDAFIGMWMLQAPHGPSQPPEPGAADLGYRLLRRHWRQGYAREGSQELIRHGFDDLGLHRIFAETMAVNAPSRATMASVGMRFVRGFVEPYDDVVAGAEQGEVEYEIRRADWRAGDPAEPRA